MGGSKEAGIKLTLNGAGFTSGLRAAENEGKATAGRLGKAFSKAWDDGVKGAGRALSGAFSTIKSTISSIAPLIGGLSAGALIADGIKGEAVWRKLAFAIRAGGNSIVDFKTLQNEARSVAIRWGQETEALGETMQGVFSETGDADFARKTIEKIAIAATATREPVQTMGKIVGTLNEKFGITDEQVGDVLASVISLGNKGGVSIEDMGEKLGVIGANAKEAGLSGTAGFEKVIALMNIADNSTGNLKKGISGVSAILETLGNKTDRNKALMKLGINPAQAKGDVTKTIEQILAATKGKREKLELAFNGEALKILLDMGNTYASEFEATKGDVKTKTSAANAAFEAALEKAGKSSLSYADLQDQAKSEVQSADRRSTIALEKLKDAFSKPEITAAIEKLIGVLPGLADVIGGVVSFASAHPIAAAAIGAGAIAGKGFAGDAVGSLITSAFARGGTAAAGQIAGALGSGGAGAATSIGSSIAGGVALFGAALAAGAYARHLYNEHEKKVREEDLQKADAGGEAGKGGTQEGDDFLTYEREGPTGELKAKRSKVRRAIKGLDSIASRFTDPNGEYGQGDPDDPLGMKGGGWDKKGAPPAAAPQRSSADAKLFADMLAGRTLRVEVTNADEIRAGGAGGVPPTPAPGYAPR